MEAQVRIYKCKNRSHNTRLKANQEHSLVLRLKPGRKASVRSTFQAASQDNNSRRTD